MEIHKQKKHLIKKKKNQCVTVLLPHLQYHDSDTTLYGLLWPTTHSLYTTVRYVFNRLCVGGRQHSLLLLRLSSNMTADVLSLEYLKIVSRGTMLCSINKQG